MVGIKEQGNVRCLCNVRSLVLYVYVSATLYMWFNC